MEFPQDDFILVCTDGPETEKFIEAVWKEVNAIVSDYGGLLDACGPIAPDRAPFEELFSFRRFHSGGMLVDIIGAARNSITQADQFVSTTTSGSTARARF